MESTSSTSDTVFEFKNKIRSINFAGKRAPKVTVERDSRIEATTTEHWHDRQDVNIKVKTIKVEGEPWQKKK